MKAYFYSSPIGILEIKIKDGKIYSLSKTRQNKFSSNSSLSLVDQNSHSPSARQKKDQNKFSPSPSPSSSDQKEPSVVRSLRKQLDQYFSGKKLMEQNLCLYPQGTSFQNKVWECLRKIPYGKTLTYSQVAKKIHHPKAVRAVGSACGKNPWLIMTPCHRVVAQKGLGGFALGLKAKRQMLQRENIKIPQV